MGEFDWSDRTGRHVVLRNRFLAAIRDLAPGVLHDLGGSPFSLYHSLAPSPDRYADLPDYFRSWDALTREAEETVDEVSLLRDSLSQWQARWRLFASWFLDHALETMLLASANTWTTEVEGRDWVGSCWMTDRYSIHLPVDPSELHFSFEDEGWLPWDEEWATARFRINAQFQASLDRYQERVEQRMDESDMVRTEQVRHLDRDITWLVRYQVLGEGWSEIARSVDPEALDPQTVKDAVRRLFEPLHLRPRDPDPPGRPPKHDPGSG
ncbi:MAG: hypothetical protein ACRDJW_11405 [Thermomicrobiales bacterium]